MQRGEASVTKHGVGQAGQFPTSSLTPSAGPFSPFLGAPASGIAASAPPPWPPPPSASAATAAAAAASSSAKTSRARCAAAEAILGPTMAARKDTWVGGVGGSAARCRVSAARGTRTPRRQRQPHPSVRRGLLPAAPHLRQHRVAHVGKGDHVLEDGQHSAQPVVLAGGRDGHLAGQGEGQARCCIDGCRSMSGWLRPRQRLHAMPAAHTTRSPRSAVVAALRAPPCRPLTRPWLVGPPALSASSVSSVGSCRKRATHCMADLPPTCSATCCHDSPYFSMPAQTGRQERGAAARLGSCGVSKRAQGQGRISSREGGALPSLPAARPSLPSSSSRVSWSVQPESSGTASAASRRMKSRALMPGGNLPSARGRGGGGTNQHEEN